MRALSGLPVPGFLVLLDNQQILTIGSELEVQRLGIRFGDLEKELEDTRRFLVTETRDQLLNECNPVPHGCFSLEVIKAQCNGTLRVIQAKKPEDSGKKLS